SVTPPLPIAAGAVKLHVVEPSPRATGGDNVPALAASGGGARFSGWPRASTAKATISARAAPSAGSVGGTAPRKRRGNGGSARSTSRRCSLPSLSTETPVARPPGGTTRGTLKRPSAPTIV